MANEEQNAPDQLTEEASDPLGTPDSQEEKNDADFSPEDLSPEQRAQYDQSVEAVDAFIENHPTYKQTDENQQTILGYLDQQDLAISPASLELCREQPRDRLDLEPESQDQEPPESEDEEPKETDRVRHVSAGRRRGIRRREMLEALNQPDPRKVAEARRINTLLGTRGTLIER